VPDERNKAAAAEGVRGGRAAFLKRPGRPFGSAADDLIRSDEGLEGNMCARCTRAMSCFFLINARRLWLGPTIIVGSYLDESSESGLPWAGSLSTGSGQLWAAG
jgi:hypothetical protein